MLVILAAPSCSICSDRESAVLGPEDIPRQIIDLSAWNSTGLSAFLALEYGISGVDVPLGLPEYQTGHIKVFFSDRESLLGHGVWIGRNRIRALEW